MIPKYDETEHSEECNKIYRELKECYSNIYNGLFSKCNGLERQLWTCMRAEFQAKYFSNPEEIKEKAETWEECKNFGRQLNMFLEEPEKYQEFVKRHTPKNKK